jgi:hypothetical protein
VDTLDVNYLFLRAFGVHGGSSDAWRNLVKHYDERLDQGRRTISNLDVLVDPPNRVCKYVQEVLVIGFENPQRIVGRDVIDVDIWMRR